MVGLHYPFFFTSGPLSSYSSYLFIQLFLSSLCHVHSVHYITYIDSLILFLGFGNSEVVGCLLSLVVPTKVNNLLGLVCPVCGVCEILDFICKVWSFLKFGGGIVHWDFTSRGIQQRGLLSFAEKSLIWGFTSHWFLFLCCTVFGALAMVLWSLGPNFQVFWEP